jgi:transcriptional regulator of arginine metabolism
MSEHQRLKMLAKLLQTEELHNQTEVLSCLREQGIDTTQSSVSRDLVKLGVVKYEGCYRIPGTLKADNLRGQPIETTFAGDHLLVVKTSPGYASRVALVIDTNYIDGVAGTIAGDDTIFCAVTDSHGHGRILAELHALFE